MVRNANAGFGRAGFALREAGVPRLGKERWGEIGSTDIGEPFAPSFFVFFFAFAL